jgi:hypothetical protein
VVSRARVRRPLFWAVLALVVVVAAIAVASIGGSPGRPLDPASTHDDGSRALARLLARYGSTVTGTRSVADAVDARAGAVVVTDPDDYSDAQLRRLLAAAGRVVLVRPGTRAAHTVSEAVEPDASDDAAPDGDAGCSDPGARAAAPVDWPGDTMTYVAGAGDERCFGGAVVVAGHAVVLGSSDLLRNDGLTAEGAAALAVNLISADRTAGPVEWLTPGGDAAGSGSASVWDLFPRWVYRAFVWLLLVGLLLVLWRARRLGGVEREPLPVVVRAAELVEGHGRLWSRAGARDRAAHALRAATARRLAARTGLPRGAAPEQVATAVAPVAGLDPGHVRALLSGAPPADDAGLLRLATDLDRLESTIEGTT